VGSDLHNVFGADRLGSRQIDELIGLARGVLADGSINEAEIAFLDQWLQQASGVSEQPLINGLLSAIRGILADGKVDEYEKKELFDTLRSFTGPALEHGEIMQPSDLPLCKPAPPLFFRGQRYCFTGTFAFGQRKACESVVIERGGLCGPLAKSTDFLVVGAYVTETWKHTTFGDKIMRAVEFREMGVPISIVCEPHWLSYLE